VKTLGEFYREKVLSQDDLKTVEWPYSSDSMKIIKDLFGPKLCSGKNCIECSSEEEARYLIVFFNAGMTSVSVPTDNEYLSDIILELEGLKRKIDKIINSYLESILSRKIRERVKHEVFMEITK